MYLPIMAFAASALLLLAGVAHAEESPAVANARSSPACHDKPPAPAWLDRMQASLYRATCLTASRFDGLFGDERFDEQYQATYGRLSVGAIGSERDQLEDLTRFRLHMRLPQLGERFGVFLGQDDVDDVTGSRTDLGALRHQFGLEDDDDVLIGLGYRRPVIGGGFFDTSLGSHFGSGFDPYIRGRYRLALPFLERNVARLSETVFVQDKLGVGGTSRLDVDRMFSERFLARWTGSVTAATHIEGIRWYSGATLYQSLGFGRALAYQLEASGETGAEVPLSDYGLRIVFRRRALRDWLFLELSSGVTWPRESLLEMRERNLACGIAMEMWFGETGAPGG